MKVDLLDTPTEDVRIEIIPLIDVIFCILTFFILAAVGFARQQAIDLDLPSAQTGQPLPGEATPQASDRLYVSVDGIGQIYLDQQPVTQDLLYDVLQQHQQVAPNGLIVLYASRDARYEDVVNVLDILRAVGGDRVALATLPREAGIGQPQQPGNPLSPQPGIPNGTVLPGQGQSPGSPLTPAPSDVPLSPFGTSPSPSGGTTIPTTPQTTPTTPQQQAPQSAPLSPDNE
ncbi:MAG TPA: biopolymer transporter ExbD [Leptolyngbyaceae cyanobacterium]